MNPALIELGVAVGRRLINKKKLASKTNVTTAVGTSGVTAALMTLATTEDPLMQVLGGIGLVLCGIVTFVGEQDEGK